MIDLPEWAPTPEDVHAEIPTRAGQMPFSDQSIPTRDQVLGRIRAAFIDVETEVGAIPEHSERAAWRAVCARAAYLVELSLYPEQTGDVEALTGLRFQALDATSRLRRQVITRGRDRLPTNDSRRTDAPDDFSLRG